MLNSHLASIGKQVVSQICNGERQRANALIASAAQSEHPDACVPERSLGRSRRRVRASESAQAVSGRTPPSDKYRALALKPPAGSSAPRIKRFVPPNGALHWVPPGAVQKKEKPSSAEREAATKERTERCAKPSARLRLSQVIASGFLAELARRFDVGAELGDRLERKPAASYKYQQRKSRPSRALIAAGGRACGHHRRVTKPVNNVRLGVSAGWSEQRFADQRFNFVVGYRASVEVPDGTAVPVNLLKGPPALVPCCRRTLNDSIDPGRLHACGHTCQTECAGRSHVVGLCLLNEVGT